MGKKNINVDLILQSVGRDGTKDISFTVSSDNLEDAMQLLKEKYPDKTIEFNDNVSKVSIVGGGMQSNAGVAAKMFEALYNAGININMISTSDIKISVLIDREYSKQAVQCIHEMFFHD